MRFSPTKIIRLMLPIIVLFLTFSCNKDSDLLADYVVGENGGLAENVIELENGTIITSEDKMIAINILRDHQSSAKRKSAIVKKVTQPKNGKTEIQKDSVIVYVPNEDFNGKDDFTYTVEETKEDNTTVVKENTVAVDVSPELDAVKDTVEATTEKEVTIDVLKNDTFNNKEKVTVSKTTPPEKGTVVINKDNTITYTPNADASGEDTFTYTTEVKNADNTVSTDKGTVTVAVTNKASITNPTKMGELKAFPGAEGFGKNATGGRGGRVIYVTNTNASGSGSFKAALEASGARTIIFRIGGTIDMSGETINIYNGDLTIAGETAPGDGILIKDGSIAAYASNIIVRHIRMRGPTSEAFQFRIKGSSLYAFDVDRIIIDHCSFSWAKDQTISVANAKDVTIQNSLITGTIKSILAWGNKDLSVLNNIMALSTSRNLASNQQEGTYLVFEEINNLVYGFNWAFGVGIGLMGTIENNIFESSNSFEHESDYVISFTDINPDYYDTSNPESMTYVYAEGNTVDGSFSGIYDPSRKSWRKSSPLYRSTYVPKPIAGLKNSLLSNAGAFPWNRDRVDKDVISHINAKTGTLVKSGTYPTIKGGSPYADSDKDGMSDNWENANNLNPKDGNDGQKDRNGDGYTNLEEFLYYLTLN